MLDIDIDFELWTSVECGERLLENGLRYLQKPTMNLRVL